MYRDKSELNYKMSEEIIAEAIEKYGVTKQLNQVNEELAELIVEVAKNIRGFDNRESIIEEIADVFVCFQYLKMILEIKDTEIQEKINFKLDRLKNRMKE